jgi:dihydroorotate dehydrogenase electron transfer subunit
MSLSEKGLVLSHQEVAKAMFLMEFEAPALAGECKPGQFLHVRPGSTNDPLLRRPISLYDVDQKNGRVSLLYRVVGKGTNLLTGIKVNDTVDVMGPLGRGFAVPDSPENILLVGGGIGTAPLVYLGRVLKERNCKVQVICGAASADQLVAQDKLQQMDIAYLPATVDGSAGLQGLVTDVLATLEPNGIDRIYTCGPEPMMELVAQYAKVNNIWGEVSLEEHMACGVGACLGCARKLKNCHEGYVKVYKDGPVFNMNEVCLYKN